MLVEDISEGRQESVCRRWDVGMEQINPDLEDGG